MPTQIQKKSKFSNESPKSVKQRRNLVDNWYNEIRLDQDNIERIADILGGELRQAWVYGEWVNVAIKFTQTWRMSGRGVEQHSTKHVFLGEYLEENQRTGFVHVLRESLDKDGNGGL